MKRLIICIALVSSGLLLQAQAKFITEGKVEFERRINVQRQRDESDDFFKEAIAKIGNFHSSLFSLSFDSAKTVYQPAADMPNFPFTWIIGPAKQNIVVTDMSSHGRQSAKQVFEQSFIIGDTTFNQWKIADEKRTIAGFECRKAITIICDSVYVVAFYTDEIAVSGGPESFNGLPGMILGLVVPRLYTTWFATKVTLAPPSPKDFNVPNKGKKANRTELQAILKSSLSDWGAMGQRNIWWTML